MAIPEGMLRQAVLLSRAVYHRPLPAGQGHRPHRRGLLRPEPPRPGHQPPHGAAARAGGHHLERENLMLRAADGQESPERAGSRMSASPSCAARSCSCDGESSTAIARQGPPPADHGEHLARVIELWTKIPASKIQEEEFKQSAGAGGAAASRTSSGRTRPSPPCPPPSAATAWASRPSTSR